MVDTSPTTHRSREAIRKQIIALRQSLTQAQQDVAAEKLLQQLQTWPLLQRLLDTHKQSTKRQSYNPQGRHPLCIGAYLAVGGEINLAPTLEWLQSMDVVTALPVMQGTANDKHLLFAPYKKSTPLRTGKYNIPVPDVPDDMLINPRELNIVLVPLVGFDQQGNRLGMGGGYYDRTFAFRQAQTTNQQVFAGVAHQLQKVDSVPVDSWDISLDAIITDVVLNTFS